MSFIIIRAPLRRGVVHDTMEDVVAGPNPGAMLKNARAWITASRTDVGGGGESGRQSATWTRSYYILVEPGKLHSQIKCVHLNVKKFIKGTSLIILGSRHH